MPINENCFESDIEFPDKTRLTGTVCIGSTYCMSLWAPGKISLLNRVKVAYNDAFRSLFSYSRNSSASKMFVENGVDTFTVCRRKAAFSLLQRVSKSDNILVQSIFFSRAFCCSSIVSEWKSLLLRNKDDDTFYIYNFTVQNLTICTKKSGHSFPILVPLC